MALLAVSMSGNYLALNPLVVVPSIMKAPLDHTICLLAFLACMWAMSLVRGMGVVAKFLLPIPFLGSALSISLTLYFFYCGHAYARSLLQCQRKDPWLV